MIHHWIFVSFLILSFTLLSSAEVNSTIQTDVKAAVQTVGKFLKDDGGPKLLTGSITEQSAPLKIEDLMKAIIDSTIANETVKQAANIIKLALDEQKKVGGNFTELIESEIWKYLIDHAEEQDDIVCIYHKSYNVSTQRSADWKKFLSKISAEYKIYLALDMGQKYVICSKIINTPEKNNMTHDLTNLNDTTPNLSDLSRENSTSDNEESNGSRSLNHPNKIINNDNDKCDSPDMQTENDSSQNIPTNLNSARRTLPIPNTANSDLPCNRPIILMMPPNYMTPMGGYNMPVWPRNGYQIPLNTPKPPLMPYYPPRYFSNVRPIPPPSYTYPINKYRQTFDYGRKRLPVTPRSLQEPQDEKSRANSNNYLYGKNTQPRFIPPRPVVSPWARSLSPPWATTGQQFDNTVRQSNFMFRPFSLPQQSGPMRPSFLHYQPATTSLSQQPCIPCPNPCDKPILLKVIVENPANQAVKVGLLPTGEYTSGRRQMSEGAIENEMGNFDEKNDDSRKDNGDKEMG